MQNSIDMCVKCGFPHNWYNVNDIDICVQALYPRLLLVSVNKSFNCNFRTVSTV